MKPMRTEIANCGHSPQHNVCEPLGTKSKISRYLCQLKLDFIGEKLKKNK